MISTKFLVFKTLRTSLPIAAIIYLLFAKTVLAVGVGAADVRSNLGDPLQVSIPVFNVANPDSLVLSVRSDMFGGNPDKQLSARLDRSNSQLRVVVYTDWALMEPYVEFSLTLQDGSVQHAKDFIVLLEFAPSMGRADPLRVSPAQPRVQSNDSSSPLAQPVIRLERAANLASNSQPITTSAGNDSVMGPYDWAQQGQIPATFGAVLDGQSLWRVARRINQAMDVSVEQMMVALYENNRDAFYSTSIDSLKAGSYLRIPSSDVVRQYSELAAQSRIEQLSGNNSASAATQVAADQPEQTESIASDVAREVAAEEEAAAPAASESPATASAPQIVAEEPLFVIGDSQAVLQQQEQDSVIGGSANALEGAESVGGDASRQQGIIDSLSKTIGDLMADNVDKEQRLQSMEARLKSLESTLDSVGLAEGGVATELAPENSSSSNNWWLWLLPILGGLGAWLLFRARKDLVSPEPELFDERAADDVEPHSIHVIGDEPKSQGYDEYDSETDFSDFRSNRSQNKTGEDEAEVEGVTFHEFDDDEIAQRVEEEKERDTIEFETTNITTFPRGTKRAIDKVLNEFINTRDFSAARDVLDAARGKELDEPNYHFQRLRILLEKNDEHGFYEYFNLVEAKFQDVDRSLQMDLANLVSRLNQS